MTMLRDLFNALTYRTAHSTPDPAGLNVTPGRWGSRTVHDPRVPGYLETRRRRLALTGLDPLDRALLDPATAVLLRATADALAVEQRARLAAARA